MLGSTVLELGPFNIPVWLLTAVAAYVAASLVVRFFSPARRETWSRANDLLTTALITGLAVWKLTPLVTRFAEIAEQPSRLLYYPGGAAGLVAGLVAAAGVAFIVYRSRKRGHSPRTLVAAALTLAFVALPVAVVSLIPAGSPSHAGAASGPPATVAGIVESAEDRPTVLVFWATWCGPCSAQMPEVERFHDDFGTDVQLLAVNLTATESGPESVRRYMEDKGFSLPVVMDPSDELRRAFDVRATPTTIVLDGAGREHARRTGAVSSAWIERRVLPFLR